MKKALQKTVSVCFFQTIIESKSILETDLLIKINTLDFDMLLFPLDSSPSYLAALSE